MGDTFLKHFVIFSIVVLLFLVHMCCETNILSSSFCVNIALATSFTCTFRTWQTVQRDISELSSDNATTRRQA